MRVYISGPMTGLPNRNHDVFNSHATVLRACLGYEVYNPAERPWDDARSAFKDYCAFICDADAIYMLTGWEKSTGARAEHALAVAVGCKIVYAPAGTADNPFADPPALDDLMKKATVICEYPFVFDIWCRACSQKTEYRFNSEEESRARHCVPCEHCGKPLSF